MWRKAMAVGGARRGPGRDPSSGPTPRPASPRSLEGNGVPPRVRHVGGDAGGRQTFVAGRCAVAAGHEHGDEDENGRGHRDLDERLQTARHARCLPPLAISGSSCPRGFRPGVGPARYNEGMLLPGRCPLCRRVGPSPCGGCASLLEQAPSLPAPAGVGQCRALVAYEGAGRELVARLKYRNARSTMSWLTNAMAAADRWRDAAVVTWIPTTSRRRRQRGFDQAELLARGVARRLRLPVRALLLRRADDSPQTGRSGIERPRRPVVRVACAGAPSRCRRACSSSTTSSPPDRPSQPQRGCWPALV